MSTTPKSGSNWCQRLQNLYNIWRQRLHNLNQNDVNGSKIGIKLASTAPKSVPNWCQRLQNLDQIGVNSSKYLLNSGVYIAKEKFDTSEKHAYAYVYMRNNYHKELVQVYSKIWQIWMVQITCISSFLNCTAQQAHPTRKKQIIQHILHNLWWYVPY